MDIRAGASDPYVGQRPFDVADHEFFFGRERECDALTELLASLPIVVLHGAAGSGKTSLLRAGLPRSLPDDAEVLASGRPLSGSPFPEAILPEHNPYAVSVMHSWRPAESLSRLAAMTLTDFLRDCAENSVWSPTPVRVFAFVDQVEDIFNGRGTRHQEEFFADLAEALRTVPTLRVVLSIRTEDLDQLAAYEQMLGLADQSYYHIGSLDHRAALAAAQRPMEQIGRPLRTDIAELLVSELIARQPDVADELSVSQESYVEPVQLQVCCSDLSRAIRNGLMLAADAAAMRRLVDRALARFSAQVVAEVAAEHGVGARAVGDWLKKTFITAYAKQAYVSERTVGLTKRELAMVRGLLKRHLIKAVADSGMRWYVLASPRLIPAVRQLDGGMPRDRPRAAYGSSSLGAAASALAAGNFDLAQHHAEEAFGAAGEDLRLKADACSILGNVAYHRGRMDVAETHYMHAAQLCEQLQDQTSVGQLLGAIGRINALRGRITAAVEDLQAAVTRLPGDLSLHTELAKALWSAGQPHAAAAVFGTVLTIEPDSAEALAGRGQIRAESGDASSALHDLRTLQRLRPTAGEEPEVRSAYALALARSGSPDSAMQEANAALALAHDNGVIFLRAARVAREARSPERATELLRRAVTATDPALSSEQLSEVQRLLASLSETGALR